jgi:hypothetical protein
MKFKIYDIFSHLIPGFLVIMFWYHLQDKVFNNSAAIPSTVLAFIIGFFINTLSSWLEQFYYFTWGGNPGAKLLEGKKVWKVYFNNHDRNKAIELLTKEAEAEVSTEVLFSIAKRIAEKNDSSGRLQTQNENFVFNRVLLTTILLLIPGILYLYSTNWLIYAACGILLFIVWLRGKQRAYYYCREVINIYLSLNQ